MNISAPFIRRSVATTLLTIGVALAGIVAFQILPVSPMPSVDYPVISVSAGIPGANPEIMATTVATPLERSLGRIAGINEMTSTSSLGSTNITLTYKRRLRQRGSIYPLRCETIPPTAKSIRPTRQS